MYKDIFDESIFASIYRQACGYEYEEDAGYSYDSGVRARSSRPGDEGG